MLGTELLSFFLSKKKRKKELLSFSSVGTSDRVISQTEVMHQDVFTAPFYFFFLPIFTMHFFSFRGLFLFIATAYSNMTFQISNEYFIYAGIESVYQWKGEVWFSFS